MLSRLLSHLKSLAYRVITDLAGRVKQWTKPLTETFVGGLVSDATLAANAAQAAALWKLRESLSEAQKPEGVQKPENVYESAAVLKATTRLVVIDVVATDKNGMVTDLRREDFKVLENGKEQKISVFNFKQPRSTPGPIMAAEKLPENVYSNVPSYNVDSSLNVVLMDALNTTVPHQAYVREQMLHYLAKMPAGRPVAVYTLGTRLTLLQDFTTDPELLKSVVKNLKGGISPLLDNAAGGTDTELLPPGVALCVVSWAARV